MSLTAPHIDPDKAIRALQDLARFGIAGWLNQAPPSAIPGTDSIVEIGALLATAKDLSRSQTRGARQISAGFAVTDPPAWTATQTRWIGDRFRVGTHLGGMDWIARQIARLRGEPQIAFTPVAPHLVDALAVQAWSEPMFRRSIATLIRTHVQGQVILYPRDRNVPALAPAGLWAATADALTQLDTAKTPLADAAKGRVIQKAAALCAEKDWAGFWDGYVMEHARAIGRSVPETTLTIYLTNHPDTPPQFHKDWRDGVPGYAQPLLENRL